MKIIGNTHLLITSLILATTFNTFSMDEPPKPKKKLTKKQRAAGWVRLTGDLLLGNAPIQSLTTLFIVQPSDEPFPFTSLPKEIQHAIISLLPTYTNAENLEIAGQTINALAQVNKELNQLINEPEFSLQLIKFLSHRFNIDNETVCGHLQTKEAKRLLRLQITLRNLCTDPSTTLKDFINVRLQGTDLNFTYKNGMTLLLFCIHTNDLRILEYLLKRGAHPNLCVPGGTTPLIESITFNNEHAVEFLLAAGADPELADDLGMTPLGAANLRGSDSITNLLGAAIKKKYEKRKKLKNIKKPQ